MLPGQRLLQGLRLSPTPQITGARAVLTLDGVWHTQWACLEVMLPGQRLLQGLETFGLNFLWGGVY